MNYTKRGFRIKDGRVQLAGGVELTVVWSRDLPCEPSSVRVYQDNIGHWYCSFVVATEVEALPGTGRVIGVDWGVRAKHRLPLSERTYTCTACGAESPRDKNSARVMLVRAGLYPAGVDGGSPSRVQRGKAA